LYTPNSIYTLPPVPPADTNTKAYYDILGVFLGLPRWGGMFSLSEGEYENSVGTCALCILNVKKVGIFFFINELKKKRTCR
jgi:hypothetical protein